MLLSANSRRLRLGCVASKPLRVIGRRKSRPPSRRTRISKSYWVLLDREYQQIHIPLSAYPILRVVLFIWDGHSCVANSCVTRQRLQSVQNFDNVNVLLTILKVLLEGFEVAIISVLYDMIRLTLR